MRRVTDRDSPYTFLQQRLRYTDQHPDRPWTVFIENVPQWPGDSVRVAPTEQRLLTSYGPCNGSAALIQTIAERERQRYGLTLSDEQVLITNGALHGLYLLFREHYRPGATALCQAPVLGSIADNLQSCGYQISFFDAQPDLEELRRRCTPDVRLIYLNSPHNPTGSVCAAPLLEQLVALAQERGIALIVDQVYDDFTFDGAARLSPLMYSDAWDQLYAVNSMSKNYGAPGLRIGWIISAPPNIAALAGRLERECIAVGGSAQAQAQTLIEQGNQPLLAHVEQRRAAIEQRLRQIPQIRFARPQGGTQFFVALPVADVEAFADQLLLDSGLVLATSSNYAGLEGAFVRVPIGYPATTADRAIALLEGALAQAAHD